MSMKLVLLGTVVGTLGLLTPASADVTETWDFTTPIGIIGPSHDYVGTTGTIITATAFGRNSPSLVAKDEGEGEAGVGLTNDQGIGIGGLPIEEITPGSFIQLNLSNINFAINSVNMSFQAMSATNGETWELFGTNTSGTLAGATLLASCTAAPGSDDGNSCDAVTTINGLGNFTFADVTALGSDATTGQPSGVLLTEVNTVPGPIVGSGLPGLIAACGGLIVLARRRRRQLARSSIT